jgi:hypothetical protein
MAEVIPVDYSRTCNAETVFTAPQEKHFAGYKQRLKS